MYVMYMHYSCAGGVGAAKTNTPRSPALETGKAVQEGLTAKERV